MDSIVTFSNVYLMPIYAIIFCYSLIRIFRNMSFQKQNTTLEAILLTSSFLLIVWSLGYGLTIQ